MKALSLALATAATICFAAPAFAQADLTVRTDRPAASKKVVIKHERGPIVRKKIIVRNDNGLHRGRYGEHRHGWRAHHAYGSAGTVVVKKKPGRTVIKKFD